MDTQQLIKGSEALPGGRGELLFQCLNVGELDRLSPSSGFDHFTLEQEEHVLSSGHSLLCCHLHKVNSSGEVLYLHKAS